MEACCQVWFCLAVIGTKGVETPNDRWSAWLAVADEAESTFKNNQRRDGCLDSPALGTELV